MPLLAPLNPDERTTFLVVALPQKTLRKLAGSLGTAPPGTRLDTLSVWDLAWSLVDYYENDHEVAATVDRVLRKEIGTAPLADAVATAGGSEAVTTLLLESRDPARDLAWALLTSGVETAGPLAARCVQTIIADYDQADAAAREEQEQAAETPEPAAEAEAERLATEAAKEARRAQSARDRALKRVDTMKERLIELEQGLATARRDLRVQAEARERVETERDRLTADREALRAQLQSGTAAEVARLAAELDAAARRSRALEEDLDTARDAEASLQARLRSLEAERSTTPGAGEPAEIERGASSGATWSLPVFTDEFYDSIRRWDRKIVRITFEKIVRLAEDWRHPSLRAIPLEGIPDYYRIRIASDVRLIYRPLDGGRVEILSLIDREDLQRYVRQAKSRLKREA
ncbi:MAG: hypothetical protein U0807_06050 [Candidatus Binatia bacterium]